MSKQYKYIGSKSDSVSIFIYKNNSKFYIWLHLLSQGWTLTFLV